MCGIVGYIGERDSQNILLEGLKKLEYRGYDSAGVAVYTSNGLVVRKSQGRLAALEGQLSKQPLLGAVGIGHTRWATHGKPSDLNSHPHVDNDLKFSVVHNGIIENYITLKEELIEKGYRFVSDTDTEVISHLIADEYCGDIVTAVRRAVHKISGSYALAVLTEHEPDKLVAVRMASPLIIGVGDGENFIGSDIPAILQHTRDVYILNDGEMAVLTKETVDLMTFEGNFILRQTLHVDWDTAAAEKGGFDHYMLKEIHEQPKAFEDTMRGRIAAGGASIVLPELTLTAEQIRGIRSIHMVACGTAYHAALVGKATLVIVVSQSGETADTLAALREAKNCGAHVLAITNVIGSSIAREADYTFLTCAGPEIAVASTKAFTTQLVAFYLLGLHLSQMLDTQTADRIRLMTSALKSLPEQAARILEQAGQMKQMADRIAAHDNLFFIGRGLDYASVLEGSLKLKEISYIHSEAYAAGELKHGTLALIEEGTPVIALATQEHLFEKTVSNIKEVKARGAYVFGIALEGNRIPRSHAETT